MQTVSSSSSFAAEWLRKSTGRVAPSSTGCGASSLTDQVSGFLNELEYVGRHFSLNFHGFVGGFADDAVIFRWKCEYGASGVVPSPVPLCGVY